MFGSLKKIGQPLAKFFRPIIKHHAILFTLYALISMIAAVYITNAILSQPPDEEYRMNAQEQSVQTNFDQSTIERINDLRERGEGGTPTLPPGRINPFTN